LKFALIPKKKKLEDVGLINIKERNDDYESLKLCSSFGHPLDKIYFLYELTAVDSSATNWHRSFLLELFEAS